MDDINKDDLFCDYYEKWIKIYKEGAIRKVTLDKYKMTLRWLRKLIPDLKIKDLTRISYQELLNNYALEHERQTTMDFHHQLKGSILDAVDEGLLDRDPTRKAIIKGKTPSVKKVKFINQFELHTLLDTLELKNEISWEWMILLIAKTGLRFSEALALTPADFNFKKKTLRINKSYQRLKGEDVISTPKTKNSVRTVIMPQFLCDEMQDCLKLYYSLKPDDRIFPVTKYYLNHEMERGCKASGVKKIRVHDLRHSHVSLLINMGYTALAIGKRVGHSAEKITYRYAHLFPSVQQDMAEQLDAENMDEELNEVEGGLANVG